jgi:7,8-dihydropterin-6-yl-methyl-4-(beta-D-ribofuranosyl)aminobenzene 5'-phosphate synthase
MKITIIYDNTTFEEGLTADWGFACLIEVGRRRILFDTGAKGDILLANMKKLRIDPAGIDSVFISHDHWDHTGGLEVFLDLKQVPVYVPPAFKSSPPAGNFVGLAGPVSIDENIFSTGELGGIEQSLAVKTEKGNVIIVGCAHSEVKNILKTTQQFGSNDALIGGLHGFDEFDLIRELRTVCPTHCTQHIDKIKELYPDKYIPGGAGQVLSFDQ